MSQLAIIQPNEITNARYEFTALQKNIIYMIYKELQGYLTKEAALNEDLFNNFVVSVPVSVLAGERNHPKVIEAAKGLMTKPMEYKYSRDKKHYTVATVLVHTAKHAHGSDTVELYIPKDALSLLLYIGKGFTIYQLPIAMTLRSKHSKRIYELCCRWADKGGFTISVEEFRHMLCLENEYVEISMFRRKVLDVAKTELKESADVWFEYELRKIKSRSFNTLTFTIFSNDLKQKNADKGVYPNVYNFLANIFPAIVSDKAMRIADELTDKQQLAAAWSKLRPLWEKYGKKSMERRLFENTAKKVLREDFGIKC